MASVAENAPWAFDATVDMIAHMSCGAMTNGYDTEAFFSFAGGAFENQSGLKFTQSFVDYTGGVSPSSRQSILAQSPLHSRAKFQVAVRNLSDIKQVLGSLNEGFAYGSYPAELTSPDVALSLPQAGGSTRVNNFSTGRFAANNDLLQGTFSQSARTQLNTGAGVLGFTFSNDSTPAGGLGPSADRAYGRGFTMSFVNPSHISTAGAEYQINSVNEFDLSNGNSVSSSWSCSSNLRYMVVQFEHIGNPAGCGGGANRTPGVEEIPANQTQANELSQLRKFLPVTKWGIDLAGRCIVPKSGIVGSCYGNAAAASIVYPGNGSGCNPALNTCPHYVTICQRN